MSQHDQLIIFIFTTYILQPSGHTLVVVTGVFPFPPPWCNTCLHYNRAYGWFSSYEKDPRLWWVGKSTTASLKQRGHGQRGCVLRVCCLHLFICFYFCSTIPFCCLCTFSVSFSLARCNSDPGSPSRFLPPHTHSGTALSFPRRLAPNIFKPCFLSIDIKHIQCPRRWGNVVNTGKY